VIQERRTREAEQGEEYYRSLEEQDLFGEESERVRERDKRIEPPGFAPNSLSIAYLGGAYGSSLGWCA
jgi:hypothetical protein